MEEKEKEIMNLQNEEEDVYNSFSDTSDLSFTSNSDSEEEIYEEIIETRTKTKRKYNSTKRVKKKKYKKILKISQALKKLRKRCCQDQLYYPIFNRTNSRIIFFLV
jgi:sorbitol-specific phosphotransferase system component IIBC